MQKRPIEKIGGSRTHKILCDDTETKRQFPYSLLAPKQKHIKRDNGADIPKRVIATIKKSSMYKHHAPP